MSIAIVTATDIDNVIDIDIDIDIDPATAIAITCPKPGKAVPPWAKQWLWYEGGGSICRCISVC